MVKMSKATTRIAPMACNVLKKRNLVISNMRILVVSTNAKASAVAG
jgi:hypothetical protein